MVVGNTPDFRLRLHRRAERRCCEPGLREEQLSVSQGAERGERKSRGLHLSRLLQQSSRERGSS